MKLSIKRTIVTAAVALSLAAPGLTPAHAEGLGFSDVLVVSGCLTPNPAVPVNGGTGAFSGPSACSGTFAGVPGACVIASDPAGAETLPENCDITFSGTYDNLACGTGTAAGTANVASPSESESIAFNVTFVAGQGVITGTSASDDSVSERWAGVVDIVPTNTPPCPVTQFRFSSVVVAVDSPA
jgi:hypothetical protein